MLKLKYFLLITGKFHLLQKASWGRFFAGMRTLSGLTNRHNALRTGIILSSRFINFTVTTLIKNVRRCTTGLLPNGYERNVWYLPCYLLNSTVVRFIKSLEQQMTPDLMTPSVAINPILDYVLTWLLFGHIGHTWVLFFKLYPIVIWNKHFIWMIFYNANDRNLDFCMK